MTTRWTNWIIRFLIDTNILVYAYDSDSLEKQVRAEQVLVQVRSQKNGAMSVQVLGEFFVNVTRKIPTPLSLRQADRLVEVFTSTYPVFDLTPMIVQDAVRDVQRFQLSYWDALLVATARANGVSIILSEDLNDGQVYDGVRVANPFVPGFDLALLD